MEKLTILKLGGSVVTEKNRTDYTVRLDLLKKVFTVINTYTSKNPKEKIIIIHGAGGHIHALAKKYGLRDGVHGDAVKRDGAAETHTACLRLNNDVTTSAEKAFLKVQGIDTSSVAINKDKKLHTLKYKKLQACLDENVIPVLHGDMVVDTLLDYSICSGDTLATHIAHHFKADRLLFATDVDGIYSTDPHTDHNATLLEHVTLTELQNNQNILSHSHNIDVTDGLKGKLDACKGIFKSVPSLKRIEVCNGLIPENIEKMLQEESFKHTTVTK